MDDLRWALLGLGLLFIVGLTWWELRKPRHTGRRGEDDAFTPEPEAHVQRRIEPRMGAESVREDLVQDELPSFRAVDGDEDPPLLIIDEMRNTQAPMNLSIAAHVAIDSPGMTPPLSTEDDAPTVEREAPEPEEPVAERDEPTLEREAPAAAALPPAPRRGPPEPRWPPEEQRRIISLRLVPRPPARFGGRSLRMAFEACGLEFGAFDIFHLVDDAGDVVASAANLMRPGNFAAGSMDTQHYHGVHLFCVLPGPLPPGRAVDELIALARDLAQRVSGIVLDHVGQPLDEERAATVRAAAEEPERSR